MYERGDVAGTMLQERCSQKHVSETCTYRTGFPTFWVLLPVKALCLVGLLWQGELIMFLVVILVSWEQCCNSDVAGAMLQGRGCRGDVAGAMLQQ